VEKLRVLPGAPASLVRAEASVGGGLELVAGSTGMFMA
jgi:hypothetical protein